MGSFWSHVKQVNATVRKKLKISTYLQAEKSINGLCVKWIYVKKSHRQRNRNDLFIRNEALEIILGLILLDFQGLYIRKYYKWAPQLATKESKSSSTRNLIVLYKLNNARSQKLPTLSMKKGVE